MSHDSPFKDIPSYKNDATLSADFINEWVVPYYMTIAHRDKAWIHALQTIKPNISRDTSRWLLGDSNWRSRLVGSYFAGIKGYSEMISTIGIHLLKSEVCCVGHIYALTLAFFNTPKSVEFLDIYLGYYLTKPELYFDQLHVMEALLYLDKTNGSRKAENHTPSYLSLMHAWRRPETIPTTGYFDEQIPILKNLNSAP